MKKVLKSICFTAMGISFIALFCTHENMWLQSLWTASSALILFASYKALEKLEGRGE